MNILSNMIRRIKPIISIMIILLVVFIVYNIVFRQNVSKRVLNEQLTFQNINSSPHYQLGDQIEVDGETIIYNSLIDKGDKLLVDVTVINEDVKFKLLYNDYSLVLGYHDKAVLEDNYDYLDGQAYFKIKDLKPKYNQIIIQSNSDANELYVVDVK